MRSKDFLILIAIILFGFFLRVYRINENVPSLYADEVGGNYHSWVLFNSPETNFLTKLTTGITSYTWAFGLTPLSARLPSAIYGSVLIAILYVFSKSITKDTSTALLTSFLGVIVPWEFMLSRISFTHVLLVAILICFHHILFMHAKGVRNYLISLIPLIFSVYYYPSMVIISPFILALVCYEVFRVSSTQQKRLVTSAAIVFVVLVFVVLFQEYRGISLQSRGIDLAIWRDVNVVADSNYYRGLARLSTPSIFSFNRNPEETGNKILYNNPISIVNVFTRNYLSFFSPEFLFLKGDTTLRQSTGMVGNFFPILLPFMIYGGYLLTKLGDRKVKAAFIIWIIASPIPGALTKDGQGYLLRVVTMMPFLTFLSAFGLVYFYRNYMLKLRPLFRFLLLVIITMTITFSAYSFFYGYFHVYPALAAKNYEYGFKELSDFQTTHGSSPLLVVWNGYYPHYYFRFWQKTPTSDFRTFTPKNLYLGKSAFYQLFPNLYFSWPATNNDLVEFLKQNKILYTAFPAGYLKENPDYKRPEKNVVEIIKYPDQTDDFVIYRNY